MSTKWTEVRNRAARLYSEGFTTWTQLSEELGIPRRTLTEALKRQFEIREPVDIALSMIKDSDVSSPVIQRLLDSIQPITLPAGYAVKIAENRAIVFNLGDLHYGARFEGDDIFPGYDSLKAGRFLRMYFQWIRGLTMDIKPDVVFINILGDLVDGTHLRIQHARETDMHMVDQIMDVVTILVEEIASLSSIASVVVNAVPGNHSRIQQQVGAGHSAENADLLIVRFVAKYLENTPVKFNIAKNWYVIFEIMGRKALVFHGDTVKGQSKLLEYLSNYNRIDSAVEYGFCGHYHQETTLSNSDLKLYVNGAFQTSSEYTGRRGMFSRPSQKAVLFDKDGAYGELTFYPKDI